MSSLRKSSTNSRYDYYIGGQLVEVLRRRVLKVLVWNVKLDYITVEARNPELHGHIKSLASEKSFICEIFTLKEMKEWMIIS